MIVLIEEIKESGLDVQMPLTVKYLDDVLRGDGGTGFTAKAPSELKARFDKVSGGLFLKGTGRVKVEGCCKRCLKESELDVPISYFLNLVKEQKASDKDDEDDDRDYEGLSASFDTRASEEEIFNGRSIDLGQITREQILLALPMDILCKESCQGLCSVCGKDLNEGECGCDRKVPDPRLAKLKDIKLV